MNDRHHLRQADLPTNLEKAVMVESTDELGKIAGLLGISVNAIVGLVMPFRN